MESKDEGLGNEWDKVADSWDGIESVQQVNKGEVDAARDAGWLDNEGSRCIDFGCGTGSVSLVMGKSVGEVVGIDTSKGMTDKFDSNAKAKALPWTSTNICIKPAVDGKVERQLDGSFQLCHAFHVLSFIDGWPAVMESLIGHLDKGGRIIVADWDANIKAHGEESPKIKPPLSKETLLEAMTPLLDDVVVKHVDLMVTMFSEEDPAKVTVVMASGVKK